MPEPDPPETPSLSEALIRWTDPERAEAVRRQERKYIPYHLHEFYRIKEHWLQLTPDRGLRQPTSGEGWAGGPDFGSLIAARRALERDLVGRLVRGEFHLVGVRTAPDRTAAPRAIPGVWAADMRFDFAKDVVSIEQARYVAVRAVRGPGPGPEDEMQADRTARAPEPPSATPPLTPESVRGLTDEEVIVLLEEHARRVVEDESMRVLDPGITKVSFMPLILRKMRSRAETGQMLDTLVAEAAELERWIQGKAPSHQTPTATTIENALRNEYRRLKP